MHTMNFRTNLHPELRLLKQIWYSNKKASKLLHVNAFFNKKSLYIMEVVFQLIVRISGTIF